MNKGQGSRTLTEIIFLENLPSANGAQYYSSSKIMFCFASWVTACNESSSWLFKFTGPQAAELLHICTSPTIPPNNTRKNPGKCFKNIILKIWNTKREFNLITSWTVKKNVRCFTFKYSNKILFPIISQWRKLVARQITSHFILFMKCISPEYFTIKFTAAYTTFGVNKKKNRS